LADRIAWPTVTWRASWLAPAAALACLAVLVGLELTGTVLTRPDSAVLSWMVTHRSGRLTTAAVAVTNSGTSPLLFPLVAAAGVAVALRVRRWAPGLAAMAVLVVGVLSRLGLSKLVGDARPPRADWLVPVTGFSFPSGHAATSALVAGTLAWLLSYLVRGRPARLAIAAALGGWAVLVALSRIYLGVHWASDIVGSWLLAAGWLACLALAVRRPLTGTVAGTTV
jgi:membrane-associated phospholipid phosphatase